MIQPRLLGAVLAVVYGLSGCNLATVTTGPVTADLRAESVRGERPNAPEGACWASDETPAVIETVTDQIAEAENPDQDAGYRTETRQEIVQPREKIWFRTPCDAALSPDVVTTLQRALAARGLYTSPNTGVIDPPTRRAIRAFQLPRGLNSDRLSLAAARELGVVAADFGL